MRRALPPLGSAQRRRAAAMGRATPAAAISRAMPLLALAAALVCCTPARATFSPFKFVSGEGASPSEHQLQADYAYDPAISADGRYVAFVGSMHSQPGIYRKDLDTGELVLVAPGADAGAPSISESGQYVSFTSDDDPHTGEPTSGEPCENVYVADLGAEPSPGTASAPHPTYTLASAANGSSAKLEYESSALCGAASADRVALSGNGQEVAFTTISPSSLTGPCGAGPSGETCPTPTNQVAVRDLETKTTTLVSLTTTGQPVPDGAALTATNDSTAVRANGQAVAVPGSDSTAAISADGNAVAWMGIDVAAQTDLASPPDDHYPDEFAEPLWRQIGGGPAAPTVSVLAGRDPSAAGCPPACPGGLDLDWDTQELDEYNGAAPAYGSYTADAKNTAGFEAGGFEPSLDAVTPQLSANGETVALLSTQPDYGEDPNFGLLSALLEPPANAFVVNMAPGLTRAQAITRLTAWGSLDFSAKYDSLVGPIASIALSPDGSHVAFTTVRTIFPLAPPALITPPVARAIVTQLYDVNLAAGTLALVSEGYNDEPATEGVEGAALSEGGRRIALASGAENLTYGVVNGGSDVFSTEELSSPLQVGVQSVTGTPPAASLTPQWRLSATATSAPGGGALLLDVAVPGRGVLYASARAAVPVTLHATPARRGRGAHGPSHGSGKAALRERAGQLAAGSAHVSRRRRASGDGRRPTAGGGRAKLAVDTRQVAHATLGSEGPEVVQLRLTPASAYRALLDRKGSLFVTITVTFTAAGHPALTQSLQASFTRPHPLYAIYKLPRPRRHRGSGQRDGHRKRGGGRR
jgi:hypothetical protein